MLPSQVTDLPTYRPTTSNNIASEVPQIELSGEDDSYTSRDIASSDMSAAAMAWTDDIGGETPLLEEKGFTEMKVIAEKGFAVKNARLLLTYARADLDKNALEGHLLGVCKVQCPLTRMHIARESHIDGAKHMHVAIEFRDTNCKVKAFQSKNVRIFDYEGHHPNIRVIRDLIHYANVRVYLGKEDKDIRPSPDMQACAKIWSKNSLAEVLMTPVAGLKPGDKMKIWEAKPMHVHRCIAKPKIPWIRDTLLPILEGHSDARSWHWFCDYKGKVGKSLACKYFVSKYMSGENLDVLYLDLDMKLNDLCHVISSEQQEGWTGKAMLTDLMRSSEDLKQFYTNLEKVGNGFGTSGKYKGSKFLLDKDPIVVVFANWWPMLRTPEGTKTASSDRWKFYYIEQDLSARVLNLNEVRAERGGRDDKRAVTKLKVQKERQEAAGFSGPYPRGR